jgi:hypothetical protein
MKALVLLIALLGSGSGLPLFDAVVFHSQPAPARPDTGVLAAPGCDLGHSQVCALSHARASTRFTPSVPAAIGGPFLRVIRTGLPSALVILPGNPRFKYHSRAPPDLA